MTTQRTILPAEWAPHRACWTAYPANVSLWHEDLAAAQREFVDLCLAIGQGEPLRILAPAAEVPKLERQLSGIQATFYTLPYGDIWLRDTGPMFLWRGDQLVAGCFGFNGWGNKYLFEHDADVATAISAASGYAPVLQDLVLEGGSVDVDGEGTCLTSRQCLLNPNRNAHLDQAGIEKALSQSLGVDRVLWITDGLENDHTDGHIDTIARFVAPGHVVCMAPSGPQDPNRGVLEKIFAELEGQVDGRGRRIKVSRVPSPGKLLDVNGELMPASYCNFYIGNGVVVVPTYGVPNDAPAVAAIAKLFPQHRVSGSSARAIITGGGAFHCMTQQEPSN